MDDQLAGNTDIFPYIWYRHPVKTTFDIDIKLIARLKREAVRQGRSISEFVEMALRIMFRSQRKKARLPCLPRFKSGGALVDIANRDELYRVMEEEELGGLWTSYRS